MKHAVFFPLGKCITIVSMAVTMFGCASNINHNTYAVNNEKNDPIIEVVRDHKNSNGSKECRTNFYINDTKVGSFANDERADYQLSPGHYTFTVDNCQGRCSQYGLDVEITAGQQQKFTVSADAAGKPFIIVNQ